MREPEARVGKREAVAGWIDRIGLNGAVLAARRRVPRGWLTVVNYHRVLPEGTPTPCDEGVVDASLPGFERQLQVLADEFTLVGLADLRRYATGGTLPPNPAMITFDDGYRDNLEVALPVLLRHGLRATFFIATGPISDRRLFWWDRIAWMVKQATSERFTLDYPATCLVDVGRDGTAATMKKLLRVVKDHYDLDLPRFLDGLLRATGAPWDDDLERRMADDLLMTWDDVRTLRGAGMDIGSHTTSHRVLRTLRPDQLPGELRGSRDRLEAELGQPVVALAYPVGRTVRDAPAIRAAVAAAGYELAFTYGTGLQPLWRFDPLDVRRLAVDRDVSPSAFRGQLAFGRLLQA